MTERADRHDTFERLLEAVRDGSLQPGSIIDEHAMVVRLGARAAAVRTAVVRLADLGLVAPEGDAMRVVEPTFDDWADAYRAMLCLWGVTLRWTVPLLDEVEAAELTALADRADVLRERRDDDYGSALVTMVDWTIAHARNALAAAMLGTVTARWRFAMTARPVFRQWEASSFMMLLRTALTDRDGPLAEAAVLATTQNAEQHIGSSRPDSTDDTLRRTTLPPLRAPGTARVLGAIRDGRLPSGSAIDDIDLVTRLGVPRAAVPDAIARLTTMGLVRWRDGAPLVSAPTWDDWLDAYQMFAGLLPSVLTRTIPILDDDAANRVLGYAEDLDWSAELRDPQRYSTAFIELDALLGERMPNTVIAAQFLHVLDRVRYIRNPMPPLLEWRVGSYSRTLRQAVRDRDPDLAEDAGRIATALCESHIRRVLAEYASMDGWVPKS